ncbi:hypothetical protein K438DRAFT_1972078 [Mycena galopus ATCC 62051]|nr:hypothetical protein K438DRAFT_1972078 [Mycena galopus ATCC 62051]
MHFAKSALLTFTFAVILGLSSLSGAAITNVAATTLNNHEVGLNSRQSCSDAGDWCGFDSDGEVNQIFPCCDAFLTCNDSPGVGGQVAFHGRRMSGPTPYSGWINAFTVFSKKGKWLGHRLDQTMVAQSSPELLTAQEFWSTSKMNIPPAYAEVDVKLIDGHKETDYFMMAGVVGTRVSSSGDVMLSSTGENDTKENVVSAADEYRARMDKLMRLWEPTVAE